MGTILDRHRYKPRDIFNMDETGHGIGLTESTRCLVVRDTETKGKGKKGKATKGTAVNPWKDDSGVSHQPLRTPCRVAVDGQGGHAAYVVQLAVFLVICKGLAVRMALGIRVEGWTPKSSAIVRMLERSSGWMC